jgi:hypothetical protein
VRQGEVAQEGGWIGDPSGGVKAPEPLSLADPVTRFARSAARLEALSAVHDVDPSQIGSKKADEREDAVYQHDPPRPRTGAGHQRQHQIL